MSNKTARLTSEWSYPVEVATLQPGENRLYIVANDSERNALAQRLGVAGIKRLEAELKIYRENRKPTVYVSGSLRAEITQRCIVSLENFDSTIKDSFEAWFADREEALPFARARREKMIQKGHVEMPILEESEDPEPIEDGKIDLGELVSQFLSLAIDPYPRSPAARETVEEFNKEEEAKAPVPEVRRNPFEALKDWKRERESEKD